MARNAQPIDVAIVPGLPLYHGQCDTLLKTRILWSVFLYKKGLVKNILYSGNAVYTPWVEGRSMALLAMQLGVPAEHILIDTVAEHSTENLFYGHKLAREKGMKTFALATDPFQCAMLYKFSYRHIPDKVHIIPVLYDSIRPMLGATLAIDTNLTKSASFVPLEERQTYRDRLKGTRGKKITKTGN
ncbi:MAG: YdcF family protein [Bacteroidetes bacterium]|nr:YdcF family protein [Bacteroidota bacterium]